MTLAHESPDGLHAAVVAAHNADVAAHAASIPRFGIVRLLHSQMSNTAQTIGSANSTRFYRVVEGGTISKIRLSIGVSSGNICVAAYSNTLTGLAAKPGTRLATSGSVASPGTGIQDIALGASVVLAVGDWLAVGADNTTVTFNGFSGLADSTLSEGVSGVEVVFPASATPTLTYQNNRLISMIGVP